MRRSFRSLVGLATLIAVLAGACGNSDDEPSAGPTTTEGSGDTAQTDIGITDDTITVSFIGALDGGLADAHAGHDKGLEAYFEMVNEAGGVNGRQLELKVRSDGSDPARQLDQYNQAMSQDEPFLVVTSSGFISFSDQAIEAGVPLVGPVLNEAWQSSDTFFGTTGSWASDDPGQLPEPPVGVNAGPHAYLTRKLGEERIGTFGYSIAASAQNAEQVCDGVKELGVECAFTDATLQLGFTDIGATIAKIKETDTKVFYSAMDTGGCMTIIRSLKRAGIDGVLLCVTAEDNNVAEQPELAADMFTYKTTPPESVEVPERELYREEVAKRKPGVDTGEAPVQQGWISGMFIVETLKAMGDDLTRKNFIDTVRTTFDKWNAHGLVSDVDFTTNRWDQYADPNYEATNACAGYLLRGDPETKTLVQVGQRPKLCTSGITSAEGLEELIEEDDSSMEVGG